MKRADPLQGRLLLYVYLFFLQHLRHRGADLRGRLYHGDATFRHDLHLSGCRIVGATYDRTRMSHPSAGGSGLTRDKTYDWLAVVLLDPAGRFRLHAAAN